MTEMKQLSAQSIDEFVNNVQGATRVGRSSLVRIAGGHGCLRVKRATSVANQIHVGRGEPIAVHTGTGWFVVGVRWQLDYARSHPSAAQHASHAFDCMAVRASELEPSLRAEDFNDLQQRCLRALEEARDPVLRVMIRAINAARNAVANALIDTLHAALADGEPETVDDVEDEELDED